MKATAPGLFDVYDDDNLIERVSRQQVATKVETLANVTDPVQRATGDMYRRVLEMFPSDDANLATMLAFADEVGIGFAKRPADPSRAWELIFGVTGPVRDDLVGSDDVQVQPGDTVTKPAAPTDGPEAPPEVEGDADTPDVQTGLEGEDDAEAPKRGRGRPKKL